MLPGHRIWGPGRGVPPGAREIPGGKFPGNSGPPGARPPGARGAPGAPRGPENRAEIRLQNGPQNGPFLGLIVDICS